VIVQKKIFLEIETKKIKLNIKSDFSDIDDTNKAGILKAVFTSPAKLNGIPKNIKQSPHHSLIEPSLHDAYCKYYRIEVMDWNELMPFADGTVRWVDKLPLVSDIEVRNIVFLLPQHIRIYYFKLMQLLSSISVKSAIKMDLDILIKIFSATLQVPPQFLVTAIMDCNMVFSTASCTTIQ